ncbi:hypothetical protein GA0115254_131558 [Streptomyces sp. Ncost-T10-10d]|nr:hypothetical protein GA0115254_131558 [Streptomyces sp. Ncost-T10-10d]
MSLLSFQWASAPRSLSASMTVWRRHSPEEAKRLRKRSVRWVAFWMGFISL